MRDTLDSLLLLYILAEGRERREAVQPGEAAQALARAPWQPAEDAESAVEEDDSSHGLGQVSDKTDDGVSSERLQPQSG